VLPDVAVLAQLGDLVSGPVPVEYLQLIRDYPPELLNQPRGDDEYGAISDVELPCDLDVVCELNAEARAQKILDPDGDEFIWPNSLLIIGENGSGDYYCIDTAGEVDGVLQYEHQPVEFFEIADSLAEFVSLLLDSVEEEPGESCH